MTTELTLRAFGELAARGELPVHVALRGDPDVLRSRAWPGASTETDSTDPHAFLGQYVAPMAVRKNVTGSLISPVPVFWNIEKGR